MPLDTYSRDEMAVVSGATGTCISSRAPSPKVQPSGVLMVTGGFEGTAPPPGAAASGGAGPNWGSESAEGAAMTEMARQTAIATARRTTLATGLTGETVRRVQFSARNLLAGKSNLLLVRDCYAM